MDFREARSASGAENQNGAGKGAKSHCRGTEDSRGGQLGSPSAAPPGPKQPGKGADDARKDAEQKNEAPPKPVVIHHWALTRRSVSA